MIEIRIRSTGAVVSEHEFRALHPDISFPAFLSPGMIEGHGGDVVLAAPAPEVGDFQSAVRDGVTQDSLGNWVQAYRIIDWEPEQIESFKADAKAQKWEAIKAERDRRKAGGVKVGDKWFHSDDPSRIQQLGLVMMGANVPAVDWKTMDGSFVTMTQALAGQIFQAVAGADRAIFAKAEAHRVAMEASDNPAKYDILTGWPQTYEEFVAEQAAAAQE